MNALTESQLAQIIAAHKAAAEASAIEGVVLVDGWTVNLKPETFFELSLRHKLSVESSVANDVGLHASMAHEGVRFVTC